MGLLSGLLSWVASAIAISNAFLCPEITLPCMPVTWIDHDGADLILSCLYVRSMKQILHLFYHAPSQAENAPRHIHGDG